MSTPTAGWVVVRDEDGNIVRVEEPLTPDPISQPGKSLEDHPDDSWGGRPPAYWHDLWEEDE